MIICVCRNLNDAKIKAAVRAGARSPACILAHYGEQFNCGKCRGAISEILAHETKAEDNAPMQSLAAE